MAEVRGRSGWDSDFPAFRSSDPADVRKRLEAFIPDASPQQIRAWRDAIPPLQQQVGEVLLRDSLAARYSAILEYELPLESRRPDVLLLIAGVVLVIELKGKLEPSQADIDQAAAYARDLSCYHRDCANVDVIPLLVPTRARGYVRQDARVHIAGPDVIDALVAQFAHTAGAGPIDRARFLEEAAYRPLPTLVKAARELFHSGSLRRIERAHAATKPAIDRIQRIVHEAAHTRSRHLILLTGVPGAGKTLVGLTAVHAHHLDDLAVERADGKPTAPAVFLSGNGPLVDVLQYELKSAGGGGQTFVRSVKQYVKTYSKPRSPIPPEHVLVFDEAQRAFDAAMVAKTHPDHEGPARSEPEHFISFADRIPGWCVVIGLIGSGQEIHVGEEAGLGQWRVAVEESAKSREWTVHAPTHASGVFSKSHVPLAIDSALHLGTELRFHKAERLHEFVAGLLAASPAVSLRSIAAELEEADLHLRLTRSLDTAAEYLRERYAENREARFGLIASSKDKDLAGLGIPNDFQATKRVRYGPWYGDDEDSPSGRSCRLLKDCVTEFGAQGLELDATLLAWGTDFVMRNGGWSNARARGYQLTKMVKDPMQLRRNAYRVLLTRGRDACVVFVPPLPELDQTFAYLQAVGFKIL